MLRDGGAVAKSVTDVEAEREGMRGTGGVSRGTSLRSVLGREGLKMERRRIWRAERERVGGEGVSSLLRRGLVGGGVGVSGVLVKGILVVEVLWEVRV